jgi:hypothetical protein
VGCCYAAGALSFWSVLDLFLGNDNNGVVFSLGSVPRWYSLWGLFRGYISLLACLRQTKLLNNDKRAYKLRVSKFCESEMATKDMHLVL